MTFLKKDVRNRDIKKICIISEASASAVFDDGTPAHSVLVVTTS
jgi:uncharacterized protein involved in propanediol utilization